MRKACLSRVALACARGAGQDRRRLFPPPARGRLRARDAASSPRPLEGGAAPRAASPSPLFPQRRPGLRRARGAMACLEAAARAFLGGLLRDFPRPLGPEEALPWSPPGGRGGRPSPAEAPAELAELARSFLGGR